MGLSDIGIVLVHEGDFTLRGLYTKGTVHKGGCTQKGLYMKENARHMLENQRVHGRNYIL